MGIIAEERYNAERYVIQQNASAEAQAILAKARAEAKKELEVSKGIGQNIVATRLAMERGTQFTQFSRLEVVSPRTVLLTGLESSQVDFLYGSNWYTGQRRRGGDHVDH